MPLPDDLEALRARPLRRPDLDPDPLRQFEAWFDEARETGVDFAHAIALATATPDGLPSLRMVLLKEFDGGGFTFHTNLRSRKGAELDANPRAALLAYWHPLGRQVRVEGAVERLASEDADSYFAKRPLGARFAAIASEQSQPIESREALEARVGELERRYPNAEPPRPEHWGGFRLVPDRYEFWQHRENRLHDRFRYERGDDHWVIERLQP